MIISQRKQRIAVIVNYLCMTLLLIIFQIIKIFDLEKIFLLIEVIPAIGLFISFKVAFKTSRLWTLTHSSFTKLDEREQYIIYKATALSYSIFTILTLSLIYSFNILQFELIDVTLAAGLLYLAHILPASIIAWNEKI